MQMPTSKQNYVCNKTLCKYSINYRKTIFMQTIANYKQTKDNKQLILLHR